MNLTHRPTYAALAVPGKVCALRAGVRIKHEDVSSRFFPAPGSGSEVIALAWFKHRELIGIVIDQAVPAFYLPAICHAAGEVEQLSSERFELFTSRPARTGHRCAQIMRNPSRWHDFDQAVMRAEINRFISFPEKVCNDARGI